MITKFNKKIRLFIFFFSTLILLAIIACGKSGENSIEIMAGGASFPAPLYQKWFTEYEQKTSVKVNYQATGSGAGQRQLEVEIFQFAGSDAIMSDKKIASMREKGFIVHHFPTTLAAVAVFYNLDNVTSLKLSPQVLVDIFLGKIISWDDERIVNINLSQKKALKGPITVVHRSDGSGTTAILSDYLCKVSPEWKQKVGSGKSLKWPARSSIGSKKNAGVAGQILNKKGTIGYVSLDYAIASGQPVATIQNKSGNWITPSSESAWLAGEIDMPEDTRIMLTDTPSPNGYPIVGFTWILFIEDLSYRHNTIKQAKAIKDLFYWMISPEAQNLTAELNYAPLSPKAIIAASNIINKIKFKGELIN